LLRRCDDALDVPVIGHAIEPDRERLDVVGDRVARAIVHGAIVTLRCSRRPETCITEAA